MRDLKFSLFILLFAISCNIPSEEQKKAYADSVAAASLNDPNSVDDPNMDGWQEHDTITCADLQNKKIVWDFAMEHAFSSSPTSSFDTSRIVIVEGHFLDKKSVQTLVWVADYPMPSCGDGCNLIMLFSCDKEAKVIFHTTAGVISKEDVRDLDNDGVLEIISGSSLCRMGECHEHYDIFNIADTAKNVLYEAHSFSYLDGGWGDNYDGYFDKGDTIVVTISPKLIDPNGTGIFKIKQIREVKTFNGGGKTIAGITKQLIANADTSIVPLKKIKAK